MNIDTDEDFPEHPKTVRFCTLLGNPVGWAYIWKLWRFCKKYRPNGDLSGFAPNEIEFAVGWTSMDGRFFESAVKAGFIDHDQHGTRVHDWMDHMGAGLIRVDIDRVRKQTARARSAGDGEEVKRLEGVAANLKARLAVAGTRTSDARVAAVLRLSNGQEPNGGGSAVDFHGTADVSALLCSALPCESQTRARDPRATEPTPEPVPQPTPLPSLRSVPDPDPEGAGAGPTPYDLLQRYGIAWRDRYNLPWAPDRDASRAARDLLENQIGAMAGEDRAEALADLMPAVSRYLDDEGPSLIKNRHPFPWFVDRFNQYRAAPAAQGTRTKLKYFEPDKQPR